MKKQILLLVATVLLSTASAFAQGGTTGPLTWNINNGVLTISGEGDMPDYEYPIYAPWYDYQLSLYSVVMEDGITSIGSYAFITSTCSGLSTSFSIPNSVTNIRERAFYGCCNLHAITIPESVTSIGARAFSWCQNLFSITIPNSVTTLGEAAFMRCDGLSSVTILGNISRIEDYLFEECWNLTSITIPNSVTSIGKWAFESCNSLPSITIPNSVISIGEEAFAKCRSLISIIIPEGVISIGEYAFSNCRNATSVFISKNVRSIDRNAFAWCYSLDTVYNLNPVPITIQPDVFKDVTLNQCILEVPTGSASAYKKAAVWKSFSIKGIFQVRVSVSKKEYGTAIGGGFYEVNETTTITAIANEGYKFANWTKDGVVLSTENPYSFTVTEDVELVANFEHNVGIVGALCATPLRVYPNPTTGQFTIDNGVLNLIQETINNIEIFDIYGKKQSSHHQIPESSHHLINISHLPAGIYFVKIFTKAGEVVKKIVKE